VEIGRPSGAVQRDKNREEREGGGGFIDALGVGEGLGFSGGGAMDGSGHSRVWAGHRPEVEEGLTCGSRMSAAIGGAA
jgi:hypothetical protein